MSVSERAHEVLERYWIENREKGRVWRLQSSGDDPLVTELIGGGLARPAAKPAKGLDLTQKGWNESRSCVRRHRLAERLLADVLAVKKSSLHAAGCRFEHALQAEVEENICTLLGHPTACPHGSPIPEGACCRDSRRRPRRLVKPLADCEPRARGKVAFVRAKRGDVVAKLSAMGILPGVRVRLLATKPTFLFQAGESQFAIDKALASHIYVRVS